MTLLPDPQDLHQRLNYRLYDKTQGKIKNDYFQEMLAELVSMQYCLEAEFSCLMNAVAPGKAPQEARKFRYHTDKERVI